ncbi:MAG: hypothetical protein JWN68_2383 [Nocardioides sp.]|jgi:hypothetical protein|uniref:hypothetical protein n=1 Tax=Nocardioides sp. TaxID=35761 RepID=UPI0026153F99|nr:hypothetical protein [Nocardioides sp.]MCW2834430.1 hypothetical protein [Nocardioides sp.]
MTEEQIKDGYERLDSALRPPQDALNRVEKRIGARRRRRRLGAAAGTAVAAAAVGGDAAVSMGGSDDGREGVVTVSCDPPAPAGGGAGGGNLSRVYLSSPILIEGEQVVQPFVLIEADVKKLQQPRTFTLPIENADGSSESLP